MRINRIFAATVLVTVLLISCKNDADKRDDTDATDVVDTATTEQVDSSEEKEPVVIERSLSVDQQKAASNILRKLMKTKDASMFTRVLVTAGIANELMNLENEYTVLAAHNDAFKSLEPGQNIVTDPSRKAELVELVSHHILKGRISSAYVAQEIKKNSKCILTTINGKKLTATMKNDAIVISSPDAGTTVTLGKTDINGTNGIVHVVDGFLN